jgi:glycerol-3-phosphate dehydrogenase
VQSSSARNATSAATTLGPDDRAADLHRLATEEFDLLVVGGGITGAGAALDAASRGLRVALVEAYDYGSGTSSKSSKLIHGGLRYLEMLDFKLVREALAERRRLLETVAPHLVEPIRFVWPLTHRMWERAYLTAGLVMYDTMAGRGAVPLHRQLTRTALQDLAPGFDRSSHYGGVAFYDAGEDDARMVMTVLRTARGHGAAVVSRARAGENRLLASGLREVDVQLGEGETVTVRAKHVSYAAGPFTDQQSVSAPLTVRPSKGVHIMVPKDRIDSRIGVLTRTEKSVLFIIPWLDHWLIGDTDTDWPYDRDLPVAHDGDIEYLLEKANSVLARPLVRDDIVGTFVGLRPLVQSDPDADTTKLSREHSVVSPEPGVTMIAGGKYTTYRVMAADLVDAALEQSGAAAAPPSTTATLPLLGAEGWAQYRDRRDEIARATGLDRSVVTRLLRRHGTDLPVLLAEAERHGLLEVVSGYSPYLWAELRYAFSHEGARSIADVLERRTRISIQYRDSGRALVERVADLGAEVLGWDAAERSRRIDEYLRILDAEAAALATRDDAHAVAAYKEVLAR